MPWYPITHDHPSPTVHVRGIVTVVTGTSVSASYGCELTISRGRPPHADEWASWKGGKATPLPPLATPCLWQPLSPDMWKAPLPEPVATVDPQMWSATTRFAMVDEAESSELAREMERDRDDARRGTVCANDNDLRYQWWRDADNIRYEPAGSISLRMVEGRVMRALCCDRTIPMDGRRYRTNAAVLADLKRGMEALFGDPTHDWRPKFEPSRRDMADYLPVMGWLTRARPTWREWACLWGRVPDPPLAWWEIGDKIKTRRMRAREVYDAALVSVLKKANRGT